MKKNLFHTLKNTVVTNKIVLVRCDFNIPLDDNGHIIDDSRIIHGLETIKYLTKNGAKVLILTHLGRPNGHIDERYSTKVIAEYLANLIRSEVRYVNAVVGEKVQKAVNKMDYGDVLVLENVRFDKREEDCDITFAQQLSNSANIYVNEAFSCSHRSHASILGIPLFLKSLAGFRFEEEVSFLSQVTTNSSKIKTLILGGSKISTKIEILKNLIPKVDNIILGGAMVNTFLARDGREIGNSYFEKDYFETVDKILSLVNSNDCNLIIPNSFQVAKDKKDKNVKIKNIQEIEKDDIIFDISPIYVKEEVKDIINKSELIIWNGPLGMFEIEPYHLSSVEMAKLVSQNKKSISIAGGGDLVAAINISGLQKDFSFVSTAGGAFLEFIEGRRLPGVEVLTRVNSLDAND